MITSPLAIILILTSIAVAIFAISLACSVTYDRTSDQNRLRSYTDPDDHLSPPLSPDFSSPWPFENTKNTSLADFPPDVSPPLPDPTDRPPSPNASHKKLKRDKASWRKQYEDVIKSARWIQFKKQILSARGWKCERCGEKDGYLELHHLNYDRLGCELASDVQLLCISCHSIADIEREEEQALETWAKKVYGDNWKHAYPRDDVEFDFQEWRAEKQARSDGDNEVADELRNNRLYRRRLNIWAKKNYGEHWRDTYDYDEIADEFKEWHARRRNKSHEG